MDVAEAREMRDCLCPSEVPLPGVAEEWSPPLCQVFAGLSVQAGSAATGPAHLSVGQNERKGLWLPQQGLWLHRTKDFLPDCRMLSWEGARDRGTEAAEGRGCFQGNIQTRQVRPEWVSGVNQLSSDLTSRDLGGPC